MTLSQKKIFKKLFTSAVTLSIFLSANVFSEGKTYPKISDNHLQPDSSLEVKEDSIKKLEDILQRWGDSSKISTLFEIVKKTHGISLDNYLEWQDEFHLGGTGYIDGIRPERLQKSVMWGIDKWDRPYIAIKFTNQRKEKVEKGEAEEPVETTHAIAIFQRYSDTGKTIATGGHFAGNGEFDSVLNPNFNENFYDTLTTFLTSETISSSYWYNNEPFTLRLTK